MPDCTDGYSNCASLTAYCNDTVNNPDIGAKCKLSCGTCSKYILGCVYILLYIFEINF